MADRPIIFSAPMVSALLAGRKTQTRRIIKPQPPESARFSGTYFSSTEPDAWFWNTPHGGFRVREAYQPDDRLWVREAYIGGTLGVANICYRASSVDDVGILWCSPIHMHRWKSRLTLTVIEVRLQRLQDITREDVIAEGIEGLEDVWAGWHQPYAKLWDDLHGQGAWAENHWVAALTFSVHHGNIDALPASAALPHHAGAVA